MRPISDEVGDEYAAAIEEYQRDYPGREVRFVEQVENAFARIEAAPLSFPRVARVRHPIVRKAMVTRFPYVIFFFVDRGEPILVAIAHGKRRPYYWRDRLG